MNIKRLFPGLLTAAIAGTTVVSAFSSANAEPAGPRFTCLSRQGVPATVALTKRGPVPVINWRSTLGNGVYTPKVRCDIVSKKFQKFYEDGTLNFLTTGQKNKQSVVCVALYKDGGCNQDLFTLKPGSHPGRTLRQLMAVRTRSAAPINESADRTYIDINELLETAPVDSSIVDPDSSAVETPESEESTAEITSGDTPQPAEASTTVVEPTPVTPIPAPSVEATPKTVKSGDLW